VKVATTNSVSCFGGNDGYATVNITQGTPAYTINWLPYGGSALTSSSSLSSGTYTVNVTDAIGCKSFTLLTINQPTLLTVSVSSSQNVSCYGDNTGSISVIPSGGINPYTYSWTTIPSTTSTVNNLLSGAYTVQVKDKNNCPASVSANITQPAAALSSAVSTTPPFCNGLNGTATANTSGGTIGYNYAWSSAPLQTSSSAAIPQGTYTLITTDNNGCTYSNVFTITEPPPVTTIANSTDTSCSGQAITLNASAVGGVGNYHYQWQPGTNNTSAYTVSPVNNTVYTVMSFDQNGCPGTLNSINVSVFSLVQNDLTMVGQATVCPNYSAAVSAQVDSKAGPVTYNWSPNLGNGAGPYVVTPVINTTYSVTVTSSVCGNSVTDKVPVVISPPPTLIIESDTNIVCLPASLQFYDKSTVANGNDPVTSWNWSFGDGTSSSLQNPSHTYGSAGTYGVNLTVSTAGGCTSNNAGTSKKVYVNDRPVAAFSLASSSLEIPFDKLTTNNKSKGAVSFAWSFGDGGTSTAFDPIYQYTTVGIYRIQLIATSQIGCKDTTYTDVTTDAAVKFPNAFTPSYSGPSGGYYDPKNYDNDIFFPYTSGVIEYRLEIFDRWGELIFVTSDINQGWDGYYRGHLCQQDVYVWKAYLKLNNGKTYNKSGDVTLLK
jgi:gliding motility-associated-like protein